MVGGQFVRDPHCQAVSYFWQCLLIARQRTDRFVMDQQSIGIFNFKVVRIGRFKFDNAAFNGVLKDHVQRDFEEFFFILEFLGHVTIRGPVTDIV